MFLLSLLKQMMFFTGSYSNNVFPEPLKEKEEKECNCGGHDDAGAMGGMY